MENEIKQLKEKEAARDKELERERQAKVERDRVKKAQEDEERHRQAELERRRRDEEEARVRREQDEETVKRKQIEKQQLEEEERRKRYISETNSRLIEPEESVNYVEKSKKDELLSKLSLIDTGKKESISTNSTSSTSNNELMFNFSSESKKNGLPPKPTNSGRAVANEVVENLHDGKPTTYPRSDSKVDLLTKLFGEKNSSNGGTNGAKLDKADDLFNYSNNKTNGNKQSNLMFSTPKSSLTDDGRSKPQANYDNAADFFSKLNNNSNGNFGGTKQASPGQKNNSGSSINGIHINRPKIDNKLLISPHKSNQFIEDIEELTL